MKEETDMIRPDEQSNLSINLVDAADQLSKLSQSFNNMAGNVMREACLALWNGYVNDQYMMNPETMIRVSGAYVKGYDVQDGDTTASQLMYLAPYLDPTPANIERYGVPMKRIMTPKYTISADKLIGGMTYGTLKEIESELFKMMANMIKQMDDERIRLGATAMMVTTPAGWVDITSDPEKVSVMMYALYGPAFELP